MNELSREERIEQHVAKLEKRITELAGESKKNKKSRTKITFWVLSGLVYLLTLDNFIHRTADLFAWLLFAPLVACGVMLISYMVLGYIIDGVIKDMYNIGTMVGRKEAIELSKLNKE